MSTQDMRRIEDAVKQVVGEILSKDKLDELMLELEYHIDEVVDRAVDEVDCGNPDAEYQLEDAKYEIRRWRELMAKKLDVPVAFVDLPYAEINIECR